MSPETKLTAQETKEAVLWVAKEMLRTNLVEGTAGNLGARLPDGNAVLTPSSVDYTEMTLEDLVVTDLDGNVLEGERGPTTEKALHLSALRLHDDINATMHCHARFATMFALTRQSIPAVIEEFVVFVGGDVPVCDYTLTGTADLGKEAVRNLEQTSAALLASHGMITIGPTPTEALHVALVVERTAQIVHGARLLGGEHPLPEKTNKNFRGVYEYLRKNPMP